MSAAVHSETRHAELDGQLWSLLAGCEKPYLVYEGVDAVSPLLLNGAVADIATALEVCKGVAHVMRPSASI